MLSRTPEPDLMNEVEQARAYAQTDFSESHQGIVEVMKKTMGNFIESCRYGLDLGCGAGDISIRVAKAFKALEIDGLDGAPAMLNWGRKAVVTEGLSQRISLHERYLPTLEYPREHYDFVFSNSLLHHLKTTQILWDTLVNLSTSIEAGPLGVFIADLMRPRSSRCVDALVEKYASDADPILKQDFHASLHAAYTPEELRSELRRIAPLNTLEVALLSDRHLMIFGVL